MWVNCWGDDTHLSNLLIYFLPRLSPHRPPDYRVQAAVYIRAGESSTENIFGCQWRVQLELLIIKVNYLSLQSRSSAWGQLLLSFYLFLSQSACVSKWLLYDSNDTQLYMVHYPIQEQCNNMHASLSINTILFVRGTKNNLFFGGEMAT